MTNKDKKRLLERGLISTSFGKIDFALPRFQRFVEFQRMLQEVGE